MVCFCELSEREDFVARVGSLKTPSGRKQLKEIPGDVGNYHLRELKPVDKEG